jgi:hypothetical protein
MPSVSKKQHNLMAAVANNPKFAKKTGIPQSVGQDFLEADKGKKFRSGGTTSKFAGINKPKTHHGKIQMPNYSLQKYIGKKEGGIMKSVDAEKNPGLAKLPTEVRNKMGYAKKGGLMKHSDIKKDMPMMKKVAGAAVKGHEKRMHGMKSGGLAAGHKSADGIAMKGKTKARKVTMKKGGMC